MKLKNNLQICLLNEMLHQNVAEIPSTILQLPLAAVLSQYGRRDVCHASAKLQIKS